MYALDAVDRLAVLRATGLLDTPSEQTFDDITALIAHILRVPVALISFIDERRQFLKSAVGLGEPYSTSREVPLTHSWCQYAITRGGKLVVTDARRHELLSKSPSIEEFGVIAYAGVPLIAHGQPIGVACAVDVDVRDWTEAEMQALERLAAIATRAIEHRAASDRLAEVTDALRDQSQLLRSVIDSMDDGIVVTDEVGRSLIMNAAAERTFGSARAAEASLVTPIEASKALGLFEVDGVTPLATANNPVVLALAGEVVRQHEVSLYPAGSPSLVWHSVNASPVRTPDGTIRGAVAVGRDITALKLAQQQLERTATRDELTGLYNRRGILEHAQLAVLRAERTARPLALVYVDLDGLKIINDELGHASGDLALVRIAAILRETFRSTDVVGRLGGDEFVVVASDYTDDPAGNAVRERLASTLAAANRASELTFPLSASVGITVYEPQHGRRTLDELVAEADQRMYEAKRAARAGR